MIKIRLTMFGRKKDPFYRIVAANERDRREGVPLEVLGFWNPGKKKLDLDKVKMAAWVKKGAQITEGVKKLLK
ncbi:MAG: 30S ribosomal protein S16 [Microgenomates group bacterium]